MKKIFPTVLAAPAAVLFCCNAPGAAAQGFEYSVGTGALASALVVDFRGSGSDPGGTYRFEYRYDLDAGDPQTGQDLLGAVTAGGGLSVNPGGVENNFITTFRFDDDSATPVFADTSTYWKYLVEGGTTVNDFVNPPRTRSYPAFAPADSGFADRFLADGSTDVWLVDSFSPTNPAYFDYVPEPASAAVLAAGGLLLLRRRRAA